MGGLGSGRWSRKNARPLCERSPSLDIRELAQIRKLKDTIFLGEMIPIAWTPCTYGGERPWFVCPRCSQRVAKLYVRNHRILCRHCHGLAYWTTRKNSGVRAEARLLELHGRLGGGNTRGWDDAPPKPKRMRWMTYLGLKREILDAWGKAVIYQLDRLEKLFK